MKHVKHNTIKSIIAAMLTLAIMFTGTALDGITANAQIVTGTENGKGVDNLQNVYDIEGTTITMKVWEKKSFDLMKHCDGYSIDHTDEFTWSSSDESVVSMTKKFYYGNSYDDVLYFILKGEKAGTATITATNDASGKTISFTVKVEAPKMTAKQKKCKHTYKVTKKATCLETGVKTCKKCKWQKTIAKKAHKWVTETKTKTTYKEYIIFECNACVCEDPATHEYHVHNAKGAAECENWCGMQFNEKDYDSAKAAYEAFQQHLDDCDHASSVVEKFEYDYNDYKSTEVKVTYCKKCSMTPEMIENQMAK